MAASLSLYSNSWNWIIACDFYELRLSESTKPNGSSERVTYNHGLCATRSVDKEFEKNIMALYKQIFLRKIE